MSKPIAALKSGSAALIASESASDVAYSMLRLAGLAAAAAKARRRAPKAAAPAETCAELASKLRRDSRGRLSYQIMSRFLLVMIELPPSALTAYRGFSAVGFSMFLR